ncbi:MAG: A24 family peptidase [Bacillota bacterium]
MWFDVILIAVLFICVITDLKNRKIYNKVIFPTLLIAFLSHLLTGGWDQLLSAVGGFFLGLLLLLIPYLLGGIGAGDVKLLAVVGALKGSTFVLYTTLYMAIAGGLIGVLIISFRKDTPAKLKASLNYMIGLTQGIEMPSPITKELFSGTYPYGVAIASGALFHLIFQGQVILW